jgi:hypothetical protein
MTTSQQETLFAELKMELAVTDSADLKAGAGALPRNTLQSPLMDEPPWSYSSFGEWYEVFKATAGKLNPKLKQNSDGGSLIDFMDHARLHKLYADKVEPEFSGSQFAKQYDYLTSEYKT